MQNISGPNIDPSNLFSAGERHSYSKQESSEANKISSIATPPSISSNIQSLKEHTISFISPSSPPVRATLEIPIQGNIADKQGTTIVLKL